MTARVLVAGFGNPLMADDGAGPAVVEALRALVPPEWLRVEHGDSDSLRLASLWRGEPFVWLVDAVVRGAAPGTVHRIEHAELLEVPQRHGTAHQLSLPESLRWLTVAEPSMAAVRYLLWGVEPAEVRPRPGLSPAVAEAVPVVAAAVLDEARRTAPPAGTIGR